MAHRDWRQVIEGVRDRLVEVEDRLRRWLGVDPELVPVPVPVRTRGRKPPRRR
jgi:hypothetical protein